MFSKPFRILLIPGVMIVLAAAIAVAEGEAVLPNQSGNEQTAPVIAPTNLAEPVVTPESTIPPVKEALPADDASSTTEQSPSDSSDKPQAKDDAPTSKQIGEGKVLFESRCGTCHSVPRPDTHTMSEWPECLNRMAARSFLREPDIKLMIQYLHQELKPNSNLPS